MKKYFLFPLVGLLLMGCSNVEELSQSVEQQKQSEALVTVADAGKEVTAGTAALVANSVMGKVGSRSEAGVTEMKDESGKVIAYIVNYGENEGFVVVNANREHAPVLAYSEQGHFDLNAAKGTAAEEWITHMATVPTDNMPDSIAIGIATEWKILLRKTGFDINTLSGGIITEVESVNNELWDFEERGWDVYEAQYWIANHIHLAYLEGLETEVEKWNYPIVWANDINGTKLCFVIVKTDYHWWESSDGGKELSYNSTYHLLVPGGFPEDVGGPLYVGKTWTYGNRVPYVKVNWGENGNNSGYFRYDSRIDNGNSLNLKAITQTGN